jgi:hypothetical protein
VLGALKAAWELLAGREVVEHVEPWAEDELSFEDHFDVPYHEFSDHVSQLSRADFELYEKTLQVNPEAAVLWVLFNSTAG